MGKPPSADEEEPKSAALESAAVGGTSDGVVDGDRGHVPKASRQGSASSCANSAPGGVGRRVLLAPIELDPSGSAEEPNGGAASESAAVGGGGDRGSSQPSPAGPPRVLSMQHVKRAKEYEVLLSKVTKSSKRASLMSVQGVLFGFTFMMSTFETSNR